MTIFNHLKNILAVLQLRFLFWMFLRGHSLDALKWRLLKAGFKPVQTGPNSWRWFYKSGAWSIHIIES